ncbi:hypothetical protein Tco_0557601 [Tanacetum coccineum]
MNSGERYIDGKDLRTAGGRSELSVGTEHYRIDIDGKVCNNPWVKDRQPWVFVGVCDLRHEGFDSER